MKRKLLNINDQAKKKFKETSQAWKKGMIKSWPLWLKPNK